MKGDDFVAIIDIQNEHFTKKTEYNPWRISTYDREFYTVTTRQKDGSWYFWVWLLGGVVEAKKYSYEIVLATNEQQVLYRGVVLSLRQASEDIVKSGACLVLMDDIIKSLRQNSKLTCKIRFIQGKNWDTKPSKVKKSAVAIKLALKGAKKSVQKGKGRGLVSVAPVRSAAVLSKSKTRSISVSQPSVAALIPGPPSSPCKSTSKSRAASRPIKSADSSTSGKLSKTSTLQAISEDENKFVLEMRLNLVCPECSNAIIPPVHLCAIGHNICGKCKSTIKSCPICLSAIGNARNFFAEELLYKVYQRCRYYKSGCSVCLPCAQIRLHENTCFHAPFACPFNTCQQLVGAKDLCVHMKSHEIGDVEKELKTHLPMPKFTKKLEAVCTIPSVVSMNRIPFYPLVVREKDGTWAFFVSSHECNNYRFEIVLKKQSKVLAFQSSVLSLRMNQTEVISNGFALVTNERGIKGLKVNDKLDYSIKVAGSDGISGSLFEPCNVSKKGVVAQGVTVKTELFANKRTSKTKEEEDEESDFDYGPENSASQSSSMGSSSLSASSLDMESEEIELGLKCDHKDLSEIKQIRERICLNIVDEYDLKKNEKKTSKGMPIGVGCSKKSNKVVVIDKPSSKPLSDKAMSLPVNKSNNYVKMEFMDLTNAITAVKNAELEIGKSKVKTLKVNSNVNAKCKFSLIEGEPLGSGQGSSGSEKVSAAIPKQIVLKNKVSSTSDAKSNADEMKLKQQGNNLFTGTGNISRPLVASTRITKRVLAQNVITKGRLTVNSKTSRPTEEPNVNAGNQSTTNRNDLIRSSVVKMNPQFLTKEAEEKLKNNKSAIVRSYNDKSKTPLEINAKQETTHPSEGSVNHITKLIELVVRDINNNIVDKGDWNQSKEEENSTEGPTVGFDVSKLPQTQEADIHAKCQVGSSIVSSNNNEVEKIVEMDREVNNHASMNKDEQVLTTGEDKSGSVVTQEVSEEIMTDALIGDVICSIVDNEQKGNPETTMPSLTTISTENVATGQEEFVAANEQTLNLISHLNLPSETELREKQNVDFLKFTNSTLADETYLIQNKDNMLTTKVNALELGPADKTMNKESIGNSKKSVNEVPVSCQVGTTLTRLNIESEEDISGTWLVESFLPYSKVEKVENMEDVQVGCQVGTSLMSLNIKKDEDVVELSCQVGTFLVNSNIKSTEDIQVSCQTESSSTCLSDMPVSCQVGTSLTSLIIENMEVNSDSKESFTSVEDEPSQITEKPEHIFTPEGIVDMTDAITDGIKGGFNAVKNVISVILNGTNSIGDDGDSDAEEVENHDGMSLTTDNESLVNENWFESVEAGRMWSRFGDDSIHKCKSQTRPCDD